jgi:hypothetical protein
MSNNFAPEHFTSSLQSFSEMGSNLGLLALPSRIAPAPRHAGRYAALAPLAPAHIAPLWPLAVHEPARRAAPDAWLSPAKFDECGGQITRLGRRA